MANPITRRTSLNLSEEDHIEYARLCEINGKAKEEATERGDARAAKRARQASSALHAEFKKRELPPPPPTPWEREQRMTLEERVNRIEQVLKIGSWAE